jgi:hypothetical protein
MPTLSLRDKPRERVLGVPIREIRDAPPRAEPAARRTAGQTLRFTPQVRASALHDLATILESTTDDRELQRRLSDFAHRRPRGEHAERAASLVLVDLLRQGWHVWVEGGAIWVSAVHGGAHVGESAEDAKQRVRETLKTFRDIQLADPAVRAFISSMEKPRPFNGARVSVLDLVDDGHALAVALAEATRLPPSARASALDKIVRPVIQVASTDTCCEHTGLPLYDIWRYFRHTWSLEYRATPGRSLAFLIRNAARPHAPVMGITSIANAALQLKVRDNWIGWSTREVIRGLVEDPLRWRERKAAMLRTLRDARETVRADDLLRSAGRAKGEELERRLRAIGEAARADRTRELRARSEQLARGEEVRSLRQLPLDRDGNVDWFAASKDALFVAKRAETLAELLFATRTIEALPDDAARVAAIVAEGKDARLALTIAAREIRKIGLSSRLLDVNVCGAVTPYRELLVGKLAALAMASREVSDAYRARYRGQPSEIASQLASRAIAREPEVCLLTTTSLYGVAASQYNRLKVSVPTTDGVARVEWRDLGLTEGWGTTHFSEATIESFRALVDGVRGARNVNNRFGEGQSPRLRQAREGFDILGLEHDVYLKHRHARRVYALELAPGARDALCMNERAAPARPSFEEIAAAWRDRWLTKRIESADVRARVAEQGPRAVRAELAAPERGPQISLFKRELPSPEQPVVKWPSVMAEQSNPGLIQSLYRALGACADHHNDQTVSQLHITTPVDEFIRARAPGRVTFVTGNPGDGKTHVLKRLASELKAARVDVCLDANERSNDELVELVNKAARSRKGGLAIAINEGILVQLLRAADAQKWAEGVKQQLLSPLVYRDTERAEDEDHFLVVDLNLRNNLSRAVVSDALARLVRISAPCEGCPGAGGCALQANAARLRRPEIAARAGQLLDAVASVGVHATMRDLQGFLAFLLTGEQSCEAEEKTVSPFWVNAFEGGEGALFDAVRRFDPADNTHPLLDDVLWRHADEEGSWRLSWPRTMDTAAPMTDRVASFRETKRRALFEHNDGEALLSSSSQVDRELRDLLAGGSDGVRPVVRWLNRFFDRDEKRSDVLYLWMTHRFDANAPRHAAAVLPIAVRDLELLVPKLRPSLRAAFPDHRPDHAVLVAKDMPPKDGLRVDRTLLEALLAAEQGLPSNFRRGEPEARIAAFISKLAKRHGDPSSQKEGVVEVSLVDRDTGNNVTVSVNLRERRYVV